MRDVQVWAERDRVAAQLDTVEKAVDLLVEMRLAPQGLREPSGWDAQRCVLCVWP